MTRSTSIPAWMPDLVQAGALEQLDSYVDKYGFRDELQKIAPTYRDNQMTVNGKIYGFPDDGDVFVMYYRKDIFARPDLQEGVQGEVQVRPRAAQDLEAVRRDRQVPDREAEGRRHLRRGFFREPPYTMFMFEERFRNEGGKFFDRQTMKATVNSPIGVKVFTEMRNENRFMPPGVEKFGFVENLAVFLKGESAMTISWPPYGRFAAGYLAEREGARLGAEVDGRRQGRLCAAAGRPSRARAGFALSVASTSKQKEAGLSVHPVAEQRGDQHQRVQLPYTLRDPFRDSHFTNPDYLAQWPDAKDYLAALQAGAKTGLLDLSLIQTDKYEEALRQGISRLWAGEDPKKILDDVAAQWDEITAAGRRRQAEGGVQGLGRQVRRLSEVS